MERQISVELSKRTLVEDMAETEDNFHQEHHSSHKSEDNDHLMDDELNCCSVWCHSLELTDN